MSLIIAVYQGGFNTVNENLILLEETITKNKKKIILIYSYFLNYLLLGMLLVKNLKN